MASKNAPGARETETISTAAMLARPVAFDSTSRNANLELVGYVRTRLGRHALPYRVSTNPARDKAALHAVVRRLAVRLSG